MVRKITATECGRLNRRSGQQLGCTDRKTSNCPTSPRYAAAGSEGSPTLIFLDLACLDYLFSGCLPVVAVVSLLSKPEVAVDREPCNLVFRYVGSGEDCGIQRRR